jgi:hypothetical protein
MDQTGTATRFVSLRAVPKHRNERKAGAGIIHNVEVNSLKGIVK